MIKFSDNNEWFIARRKLSSALKNSEKLKIPDFKKFLDDRNEFIPVLDDIIKFSAECVFANICFENDDLVFYPEKIIPGSYKFESGNFSSISEILLYVMPALSLKNSESVLNITGVTNSSLSYPVVFLKDVLFYNFNDAGISIDISTSTFGFYGRGGGEIIVKISGNSEKLLNQERSITSCKKTIGAKIIISGTDSSLGLFERDLLEKTFPELSVAGIIEVSSPCLANWIYVHVESDGRPLIFFREVPFYNHAGDLIFDYDSIDMLIAELRMEYDEFLVSGKLPWDIDSEISVFLK